MTCTLCGEKTIPGVVCCDELIAEQEPLDEMVDHGGWEDH